MREGTKTLLAAAVVFLLAIGLVACGGGADSDSTATEAASQEQSGGQSNGSDSSQGNAGGGGEQKPEGGGDDSEARDDEASGEFVPKQHDDSGGGSEQFRVKGGDNSIQEFGEEADDSEREEAATALHNFLDARAEGHWEAACSYMASTIIESLEKLASQAEQVDATDCAGILGKLTNPAAKGLLRAEAEEADVASLRIEGDRSFIMYRGPNNAVLAMPMVQEDGSWKVGGIAGTPLN